MEAKTVNGFAKFKKLMDESFGTPKEGIKMLSDLLNGESGKRLDSLLDRFETLSKDSANLPKVIEVLKIVKELDQSGALGRIDSIMMNARSPESQALVREMMQEIQQMAAKYSPKLDKLIELANTIMSGA